MLLIFAHCHSNMMVQHLGVRFSEKRQFLLRVLKTKMATADEEFGFVPIMSSKQNLRTMKLAPAT